MKMTIKELKELFNGIVENTKELAENEFGIKLNKKDINELNGLLKPKVDNLIVNGFKLQPLVGTECYWNEDIEKQFKELIVKHNLWEIKGQFRVQWVLSTETKGRVHVSTFRIKGTRRMEKDITFNFPQNRLVNHLTGETKPLWK